MTACTGCALDVDPALALLGYDTHPACRSPENAVFFTAEDESAGIAASLILAEVPVTVGDSGEVVPSIPQEPAASIIDPFAMPARTPDDEIKSLVFDVISGYAKQRPRDLQKAIGPSEIGHPCARHLVYKSLEWPEYNPGGDPLPSLVGTWAHAGMAEAFEAENAKIAATGLHGLTPRYLIESTVEVAPGLTGSADLFDTWTGTVLDWKFIGVESMRKYKKEGPSEQYEVQAQCYGLGFENAGYKVERVADVFFSRGGVLTGTHVWSVPYDHAYALAALAKFNAAVALGKALELEANPDRWALVPPTTSNCSFCPWLRPKSTDLSIGCPGATLLEKVAKNG